MDDILKKQLLVNAEKFSEVSNDIDVMESSDNVEQKKSFDEEDERKILAIDKGVVHRICSGQVR